MPSHFLGLTLPDCTLSDQEICHNFTYNFIFQRALHSLGLPESDFYITSIGIGGAAVEHSSILVNYLRVFNYSQIAITPTNPIHPNDIIVWDGGGRRFNHSMVAIDDHTWIGANNRWTFSLQYERLKRSGEIDFTQRNTIDINTLDITVEGNSLLKPAFLDIENDTKHSDRIYRYASIRGI